MPILFAYITTACDSSTPHSSYHSARCLLRYGEHITLAGAKQKKSRTKKGDWPHIYLHIIYLYLSTFAVLSVLTRIRITVHTITVLQQQPIYLTTLTRLMHISLLLVIAPHRIHHTTAHGVYYGTVSPAPCSVIWDEGISLLLCTVI